MLKTIPDNWPLDAPDYHSAEGWNYEKQLTRNSLVKAIIARNQKLATDLEKLNEAYYLVEYLKEIAIMTDNIKRACTLQKVSDKVRRRLVCLINKASSI